MTQPTPLNRRAFLSSLMTMPLLASGCWRYGRYFDIEWDEEVELHNGEIIIVHIKRTFERVTRSMQRSRWKGMEYATEISFDAGGKIGKYHRRFEGYDVRYIHKSYGNWYIAIQGHGRVLNRDPSEEIVKREVQTWIISADGGERGAENWGEVPDFPTFNIMPVTPGSEGVSQFNGTLLTIPVKMAHWKKYPRAAGDDGTTRRVSEQQPLPE